MTKIIFQARERNLSEWKGEKKKCAYTYYTLYISSILARYGLLYREKCVPETICLRLLNTYNIILFDKNYGVLSPI